MPAPTPTPRSSAAPELRRHLLFLVLSVIVLDVAVYGLKTALGVDAWTRTRQQVFTAAWVAATLVVVSLFLSRLRATRVRARRSRSPGR